jgi:hypothetical protein
MNIKNKIDSFTSFIIDPSNNSRGLKTQGMAWTASIVLGIATIGTVHLFSAVWRNQRQVDKNDTHEKIANLFQNLVPKNNPNQSKQNDIPNSTHAKDIHGTQEFHENNNINKMDKDNFINKIKDDNKNYKDDIINKNYKDKIINKDLDVQERNISPQQKVAEIVYKNRKNLWVEALKEANGNRDNATIILVYKIRAEFTKNGISLLQLSKDPKALNIFFQSSVLRVALVHYARTNKQQDVLDKHLMFLAKDIVDKKEEYNKLAVEWQASDRAKGKEHKLELYFFIVIRSALAAEGRSLSEVLNNEDAIKEFAKSDILSYVLKLYVEMKAEKPQEGPSKEKGQEDFQKQRVNEAKKLGEAKALEAGFVTVLGLKDLESDPVLLAKGLKMFLLKNHPDKNPDVDQNLIRDANQLFDMLKNDVYNDYKLVKDEARKNFPKAGS